MKRWAMLTGLPFAVALGAVTAGSAYLRLIWRAATFTTNAEET